MPRAPVGRGSAMALTIWPIFRRRSPRVWRSRVPRCLSDAAVRSKRKAAHVRRDFAIWRQHTAITAMRLLAVGRSSFLTIFLPAERPLRRQPALCEAQGRPRCMPRLPHTHRRENKKAQDSIPALCCYSKGAKVLNRLRLCSLTRWYRSMMRAASSRTGRPAI